MTEILLIFIVSVMFILAGIIVGCFMDDELGLAMIVIGGMIATVMLIMVAVSIISRTFIEKEGYDFSAIDESIAVIISYNEMPNKTINDYNKLIEKIEVYNNQIESAKRSFDFYNMEYPEEMNNTYKLIYYDYENNIAKWETGGIVTW